MRFHRVPLVLLPAWRLVAFGLWIFLLTWLSPTQALAQSTSKVATNYYVVTGSSVREILQSIARSHPPSLGAMHAFTEWKLNWHFTTESGPRGCVHSGFGTDLVITTLLPRFIPTSATPPEVVEQWNRYIQALMEHERGHANLASQAAAELSRRAEGVEESSSCALLTRQLNNLGDQVLEEYRQKEKQYDESTRHGAAQGAVLRAPREPRPPR